MLITCPECNKKISDSASICPKCGFNILKYVKEKQHKKEKSKRINEIIKTIKEPVKPEKPNNINENFYTALYIIASILLIFSIWSMFYSYRTNIFFDNVAFIGLGLIIFTISICIFIFTSRNKDEKKQELKEYEIQLKKYNDYIKNPEEYKIKIANQQYDQEEISKKIRNKRIQQQTNPKCPTCNSTNLKKISATSKVVNTAMFGIAGTKRHKTFHCNNCGYEW